MFSCFLDDDGACGRDDEGPFREVPWLTLPLSTGSEALIRGSSTNRQAPIFHAAAGRGCARAVHAAMHVDWASNQQAPNL